MIEIGCDQSGPAGMSRDPLNNGKCTQMELLMYQLNDKGVSERSLHVCLGNGLSAHCPLMLTGSFNGRRSDAATTFRPQPTLVTAQLLYL